MTKVLVSVFNNLYTDQRIEKVCQTLHDHYYNIHLIGNTWKGSPALQRPYDFFRIPLKSKSLRLAYIEYNLKLYQQLLNQADTNTILLANDLDTLLPNYLVAKKLGIPLVFDSHEIFTEMPALQGRWTQKVWKLLELKLVPKLEWMITESESYAKWFVEEYSVHKPLVISNLPRRVSMPKKKESHVPKIVLYQGTLNPYRGIPETITAMKYLDNAVFKIAGDGPKKRDYQELALQLGVENKVKFLGRLHPNDLRHETLKADVGISLEQNGGASYLYSLPNKVGDYIQARVPVLMINFPEMLRVKNHFNVGEIIDNHEPANIAKALQVILKKGRRQYYPELERAADVLCWENHERRLLGLFEKAAQSIKTQ